MSITLKSNCRIVENVQDVPLKQIGWDVDCPEREFPFLARTDTSDVQFEVRVTMECECGECHSFASSPEKSERFEPRMELASEFRQFIIRDGETGEVWAGGEWSRDLQRARTYDTTSGARRVRTRKKNSFDCNREVLNIQTVYEYPSERDN